MSDRVSAASRHVNPWLDEPERRAPRTLMVTSDLVGDVEVVDYESDTPFPGRNYEKGEPRQRRDASPARALRIPCPIPDLSSPEGCGVITNDLDETQKRQLEAARMSALMRAHPRPVIDPRGEYGFCPADSAVEVKDVLTRSLRLHIIGSPAITEDELAKLKALRARFLVPQEFPLEAYRTRLRDHEVALMYPCCGRYL
ncbi:uncharacterized protein PHALS_10752 [Plasmopara halstedii]|uniref:Uncharacterized protein n=1 Tax=Plasmopara halstedii TaxID=4781 RepID=A0A0N7L559_PLAHL|nr:uncharacterized protein PHALS_10752 [Plasmopara halstedii]CEG40563.1 hypothetical protein PHALS_10752 [Plasmopara halstedii]|eukprot:XP_024576932.1 hypothetical protein PHALS_10752 [Plasmopara halstedii]